MRISYLYLKNNAQIYSAMNLKEYAVSFPKTGNRIVVIIGRNASGKTTLLSELHPFASSGSVDARSSVVLEGEDGLKEIHYEHEGRTYIIKHHFQNRTATKKTKSFIMRDGEELNPNGNSASFKEAVKRELSIEPDFLTLIRLGPNVRNFIDKSAAERKTFMNDLLADIDIYSKYYKKINDDNRTLNALMKSVGDNLRKLIYSLQSDDRATVEAQLVSMQEEENVLVSTTQALNTELGILSGRMSEITNGYTPEEVRQTLTDIQQQIRKTKVDLLKMEALVDGQSKSDVEARLNTLQKDAVRLETRLDMVNSTIKILLGQLDQLVQNRTENEIRLSTFDVHAQTKELTTELNHLKARVREYEHNYSDHLQYIITRSEFLTAMAALQNIENSRLNLQERYGSTLLKKVLGMMDNRESVSDYVKQRVAHIDRRIQKINSTLEDVKFLRRANADNVIYVFASPEDHDDATCPYHDMVTKVLGKKIGKDEVETALQDLQALEHDREVALLMNDVEHDTNALMRTVRTYKEISQRMPGMWMDERHIWRRLLFGENLFQEDEMTDWVGHLDARDEYIDRTKKIQDLQIELASLENGDDSIATIQADLTRVAQDIIRCEADLESERATHAKLFDESVDVTSQIEELTTISEYITNLDSVQATMHTLEQEERKWLEVQGKVMELSAQTLQKRRELDAVMMTIQNLRKTIQHIEFSLRDWRRLEEEQEQLHEKFDDIKLLRDALSSTKGIPLLFIQLYFNNATTIINQLLGLVENNIEVCNFVINEKQFDIPYIKNGIKVNDVSRCSQGETSLVTIALSFALMSQSVRDYNIMLLDEIDAPLDAENKEAFLPMLEHQADAINAEQIILITHNEVFDNYPVDVIMTTPKNIDHMKMATVIKNR